MFGLFIITTIGYNKAGGEYCMGLFIKIVFDMEKYKEMNVVLCHLLWLTCLPDMKDA
jgi:hypothetical protein